MADHTFEINPELTQIALAAKPEGMIADMVCPQIDVPTESFKYTFCPERQFFAMPDTLVAPLGMPNEVQLLTKLMPGISNDHALLGYVAGKDVKNYKGGGINYDPMDAQAVFLSKQIDTARERRVATMIYNPDNYLPTQRVTLAGESQWSNPASNPVVYLVKEVIPSMPVRPNMLVIGAMPWANFRTHAKVIESLRPAGTTVDSGVASATAVADLLEIEHILVGRTQVDLANPGQQAVLTHLWGNHAALLRVNQDPMTTMDADPTFCFTGTYFKKATTDGHESKAGGGDGRHWVKVHHNCVELSCFPMAGYLFRNVIAEQG